MKTYLTHTSDFAKLKKSTLVNLLENVFQFLNNERFTQRGVDLASYLYGDSVSRDGEFGLIDERFENECEDNFYDANRALLEAKRLILFAQNDCGAEQMAQASNQLVLEDIRELVK